MIKRKLVLFTLAALMLMSFKAERRAHFLGGLFGDAFTQLNFKADHTFSYTDHFNPQKQVNLTGSWQQKGDVLILQGFSSPFKIHHKWKLSHDGESLLSRKGLEWVRICKM
jgi:hypothetical protein